MVLIDSSIDFDVFNRILSSKLLLFIIVHNDYMFFSYISWNVYSICPVVEENGNGIDMFVMPYEFLIKTSS